jgi:hypothetical protein
LQVVAEEVKITTQEVVALVAVALVGYGQLLQQQVVVEV